MAYIAANGALPEGVKYVVYHCDRDQSFCGGMGDRLFAMSSLLYYAIATRRVFFIVHDRPFPLEDTFVPRLIDWRQPEALRQQSASSLGSSTTTGGVMSGRVVSWLGQLFGFDAMKYVGGFSQEMRIEAIDAGAEQLDKIEAQSEATVIRVRINTPGVADRLWTPKKAGGPSCLVHAEFARLACGVQLQLHQSVKNTCCVSRARISLAANL